MNNKPNLRWRGRTLYCGFIACAEVYTDDGARGVYSVVSDLPDGEEVDTIYGLGLARNEAERVVNEWFERAYEDE